MHFGSGRRDSRRARQRAGRYLPAAAAAARALGRPLRRRGRSASTTRTRASPADWYADPDLRVARIVVPFPPESAGVGDRRHRLPPSRLVPPRPHRDRPRPRPARHGRRAGCSCTSGRSTTAARSGSTARFLGEHEGGHTPFRFDVTDAARPERAAQSLVVRVEDDPLDVVAAARQAGLAATIRTSIWYHRTTGIWQPVWLEAVPDGLGRSAALDDRPDRGARARRRIRLELDAPPDAASVRVVLSLDGELARP